jgi:hypothetical protein
VDKNRKQERALRLTKTERKRENNTVEKDRKKERAIPLIKTDSQLVLNIEIPAGGLMNHTHIHIVPV